MEGGVWVHVISQLFLTDSHQMSGFVLRVRQHCVATLIVLVRLYTK